MNDNMATAIGQFPPGGMGMPAPQYQTRQDQAPVSGNISYDDMLNQLQPGQAPGPMMAPQDTRPVGNDPYGQYQQPPQQSQTPQYNPNPYDTAALPGYDPTPEGFDPSSITQPQQPYPQQPQPQYQGQQYRPQYAAAPPPSPSWWSQYKDVIMIALAVVFLLYWVQPKARAILPQLFTAQGSLNVLGMVLVGVSSGLIYRVGASQKLV